MSQTVAYTLVDVLEKIGVTHIFGLIADSLNPIGDAVRHSKIEWIGVRHEEGAALAAAGQAKLTGRLGVCCGSTGPGSTHLVAGLYEACRDHAPVLALSGQMPRQLQGLDYFQATDPDLLFRDVALYTETISSPAQAPAVIHQAIATAYAGRGVAHLTLPVDVLTARTEGSVASVATLKPRPEIFASEADIAEMILLRLPHHVAEARDGGEQARLPLPARGLAGDPPVQAVHRVLEHGDPVQVQAAQQRVMLGEPPGQRHRQVRQLPRGAHPADRQVRQHLPAALPVDQRLDHRGGRRAGYAAGNRAELDAGRFQRLLADVIR